MRRPTARDALLEGLIDAGGFLLGAVPGWWLGRQFGFDFIASSGFDTHAIVGLGFILVGGGLGRWLARRGLIRPPEV